VQVIILAGETPTIQAKRQGKAQFTSPTSNTGQVSILLEKSNGVFSVKGCAFQFKR